MLEGTRKLFREDYEQFKEAMISAANDDELPVCLQLNDIRDFTLMDFQDAFSDFSMETELEMKGSFFFCHDCEKLHLLEVSHERTEDTRILQ